MSKRGDGDGGGKALARALSLFSLGLGVAELVAPRMVSRLVGFRLQSRVAARIVGDLLDAAVLVAALRGRRTRKTRAWVALGAVLGVTAVDIYCLTANRRAAA